MADRIRSNPIMVQLERTTTNGEAHSNGQQIPTPQEIARQARLRYVSDSEPGIRRRRCGRGFLFYSASGQRLTDARELERIESLAIPPAWTDVWICRFAKGHLQATGRDSRGRKQYRYHDRWQETTGQAKFSTLLAFGLLLPTIRRQVEKDLKQEGLPWTKAAALAVALLDETGIRVGNREYATDNQSYGLTTLRNGHVQVTESRLVFSFTGKGGFKHRLELDNANLAGLVAECRSIRGGTLLQYETEPGRQSLTSYDVNEYLNAFSPDITAKMFRTWHGSKLAAEFLYHADPAGSASKRKRLVSQAFRTAAEHLGNTTTVCRKYYIHPQVTELFLAGRFPEVFEGFSQKRKKRLTGAEQVLLRLLHET
jgi:DNA topoisomerase I